MRKPRAGPDPRTKTDRNARVRQALASGRSLVAVAREHELTPARVRQIRDMEPRPRQYDSHVQAWLWWCLSGQLARGFLRFVQWAHERAEKP